MHACMWRAHDTYLLFVRTRAMFSNATIMLRIVLEPYDERGTPASPDRIRGPFAAVFLEIKNFQRFLLLIFPAAAQEV